MPLPVRVALGAVCGLVSVLSTTEGYPIIGFVTAVMAVGFLIPDRAKPDQ
jgi:hypothetical protein